MIKTKILFLAYLVILTSTSFTIKQFKKEVKANFSHTVIKRAPDIDQKYINTLVHHQDKNINPQKMIQNQVFGYNGCPKSPLYLITNFTLEDQVYQIYVSTSSPNGLSWLNLDIKESSRVKGLNSTMNFFVLARNRFPYDMQKGIANWVLWSNRNFDLSTAKKILESIKSQKYKIYSFINSIQARSIKAIPHAQCFVYKKGLQKKK